VKFYKVESMARQHRGTGITTAVAAGSLADLRALERLSDAQLAAVECLVWLGLPDFRIAQRIGIDLATLRRWFRDPVFIAAANELTRAYAAGQLVPLGLFRLRQVLNDPFAKPRDIIAATRFAAELAGLSTAGAPEAGQFAPGSMLPSKPLADLSREELHRLMIQGQAAQRRLLDADNAEPIADPMS
jgi:hypothetical protein